MSGHNRWSKIKHTKAATDAKKSKGWTKLLKEVSVAAKGGGDPDNNARLRTAVDKARAGNVPNDTIKRAIQKGTGELEAESYEELIYEVYGPGGTAVVVEILTDNRNRTAGEIRKILEKGNAKLAASGSVLYLFHKKGHIVFDKAVGEDALMEAALDAGAEDVRADGDVFLVVTEPGKAHDVQDALEKKRMKPVHSEVGMYPDNSIHLDGKEAEAMVKLVQTLEDHDDVQNVYANYDIDDSLLEQLSASA
jgi:YebC/PmpR family DNA-binding regulatory protein